MDSKTISTIINEFEKCILPRQVDGTNYYKTLNTDIMKREKTFYNIAARKDVVDYTKANNRLPSNYTKIVVMQKVNYSINAKMAIVADGLENIINLNKYKKMLKKIGKNASNEIYGVLQWFINEDGTLGYKILPSKQCIVLTNPENDEEIIKVIRYYVEDGLDKCEVIDEVETEYYEKENDTWILVDTKPHLTRSTTANSNTLNEELLSWGRVPVSVLYNNDEKQTDLEMFKNYVDLYDIVISDFGNNLEDFQELYWVLKGYNGQDAEEFIREFKRSRVLKVGEGGDATQQAQEVPYNAREACLDTMRSDIYRFAMAVDPEAIGKDTTNVTIKALFSSLDLKANDFEDQINEFIDSCLYFINRYAELKNMPQIDDIEVKFNRAIIMNKQEIITSLIQQQGFRAKVKLLEEHPDVVDVEAELEALAEERQQAMDDFFNQNTVEVEEGDE